MNPSKKESAIKWFIIGTFVTLYLIVSIISTIHVIAFFRLSNPEWLAISLALAFEIGAAASLASLIALDKMNKTIVWLLFITLTLMQAMGNTYYAYINLSDFSGWSELFGLIEEDMIYQKRILSIISGAILPLVSLGFIKSLVDYIRPDSTISDSIIIDDQPVVENEDALINIKDVEDSEELIVDSSPESNIPSIDAGSSGAELKGLIYKDGHVDPTSLR
jgi:hypothetical protein